MRQKALPIAKILLAVFALLFVFQATGPAARAQVATDFFGQTQLLPPGVQSPVDYTGVQGTASFYHTSDGGTDIDITVQAAQPGDVYIPEIHDGSCDGPVLYAFDPLTVGADGTAGARVHTPDMVRTISSYVSLRLTNGKAGESALCGQVHAIMTLGGGTGGGVTPGMPSTGDGDYGDRLLTAFIITGALIMAVVGMWLGGLGRRAYNLEKRDDDRS